MTNIFKCKDEMPPKDNSPDVVRTALTMPEARKNMQSASFSPTSNDVVNVERPRFGHAT